MSVGPAPLADLFLNGDDTAAAAPTLPELQQSRPPLNPALDQDFINITFNEVVEQPESKPIYNETAGPPVDMGFLVEQVRLMAQVHI